MTVEESLLEDRFDVEQLLRKCEELVCRFEYELAMKFCQKILVKAPKNTDALLMKATIEIDTGNLDQAEKTLQHAIFLSPDEGQEKYIALAQISEGTVALEAFQRAIDLMKKEEANLLLSKQISSTYCSMAEIYLTDLCLEEGAEEECHRYIELALEADSQNFEAWQTKANFHLSQGNDKAALECLQKSKNIWQSIDFENDDYPSYEFRLVYCRLLIELGELEDALSTLEALSLEDDQVEEVWYLLALVLYSTEKFSDASRALETAEKLVAGDPSQSCPDLTEAIISLRQLLDSSPQDGPETEDEEGEEEQDDDAIDADRSMVL